MTSRAGPPSAATVALGALAELCMLPVMLVAAPLAALNARVGWTAGGRRARAARALREGHVVSIEQAAGLARAIVEGALEPVGPLVRVPVIGVEAIAWSVWAQDGSWVDWIDGEAATFDLVDEGSRARVELEHIRDLTWPLGERRPLADATDRWRGKVRGEPESWEISWIPRCLRARASGRVVREGAAPAFRTPAARYQLGPDAGRTPVLLARATR